MHIFLLGGTGRVGSQIMQLALNKGYRITALVRPTLRPLLQHHNLKWVEGNALDYEDIQRGMRCTDVVISALSTDGTTTLSKSIPHILTSMKQNDIQRILSIGTAGILNSRMHPTALRYESGEGSRKLDRATIEHHKVFLALEQSDRSYTIICPTHMPDGVKLNEYRTEVNYLPLDGEQIHVPDVSDFTFKILQSTEHNRVRIGIAY